MSTATQTLVARRPVRDTSRASRSPLMSRTAVLVVLILFALYTLLPMLWMVIAATKDTADLYGTNGFAFADINLIENIGRVFRESGGVFPRWLLNTVLYAGLGSLASVIASFLAGYAFDKFDFPGKERWFAFVLVGVLVPSAVTTMPLYLLAAKIGLVNTFWGVFLPMIASPFGVYLARIFTASYLPMEVVEAARLEGASELRIFWSIVLPMVRPGLVTLLLMSFSAGWNNFFLPLVMLTDKELFPVALGLYTWNAQTIPDPSFAPLVITGSLIAVLPVIALFIFLQRYWQSGLGAGAIK